MLYFRPAVLKLFGFRPPLQSLKLLRTPKSVCLCELYLSIFTVLEMINSLKITSPLHIKINNIKKNFFKTKMN